MIKPLVVVPVYNHPDTIEPVLERVTAQGYDCLAVDDGSDDPTRSLLDELETRMEDVTLLRRPRNGGKGEAAHEGFRWADENNYSHVVLIDADLQHDPDEIPKFLEAARESPEALIAGEPVFDGSVPGSRRYGRILSQVWVWIETLSTDLRDPLFGFRCYPVQRTLELMEYPGVGSRMEFDPEIGVRFLWDGGTVVNVQTPVTYREDQVSHFRLLQDNLRISAMHMRLFFGMLVRLPQLIPGKVKNRGG